MDLFFRTLTLDNLPKIKGKQGQAIEYKNSYSKNA